MRGPVIPGVRATECARGRARGGGRFTPQHAVLSHHPLVMQSSTLRLPRPLRPESALDTSQRLFTVNTISDQMLLEA